MKFEPCAPPTIVRAILAALWFDVAAVSVAATTPGTAFTFQGRLNQNGQPVTGSRDFTFVLYDAVAGGNQQGPTIVPTPLSLNGNSSGNVHLATGGGTSSPMESFDVDGNVLSRGRLMAGTNHLFYADPDLPFVGVGRSTRVNGTEVFGLFRDTQNFGGMYVGTAAVGLPYYGYATGGQSVAYHFYDDTTDSWRLHHGGGDHLMVDAVVHAKVVREIEDTRFVLRTSRARTKVSWQVTGIRDDAYARAHPIVVEAEKPDPERGRYLHPAAFGQPTELAIRHLRSGHPRRANCRGGGSASTALRLK